MKFVYKLCVNGLKFGVFMFMFEFVDSDNNFLN